MQQLKNSVFSSSSNIDILFVTYCYFDINIFGCQFIDFADLSIQCIRTGYV
jgi:hypothetical protein